MMADLLNSFFTGLTLFSVVKAMFVVGLLVYLAFAVIIIRQVQIMNETMEDSHNAIVATFAWAHLVLTLLLIFVSVFFL